MGFLLYSYKRYIAYHILILLFIVYYYMNSPHSLFYIGHSNISIKTLNENNRLKVESARSVLQRLPEYKHHISDAQHTVVVITTRRLQDEYDKIGMGYLTRVLARLNLEINDDNLFKTKIIVCDVNSDIAVHNEAYSLSKYFQTVHRFHDNDTNPRISHSIKDPFHREGLDYSYCLKAALDDSSVDYVTALEDDAVPEAELIWNLEFHVLSRSDWYYAKAFHPLRWLGFSWTDSDSIFNVIALSCAVACVHTMTMLITLRIMKGIAECTVCRSWWFFTFIFFIHGVAFSCAVALLVGRVNFDRLSSVFIGNRVSTMSPSPRCCTPIVTYTRKAAVEVAQYLKDTQCSPNNPVDLVISDFAVNKTTLLLQPNLVKHIGYLSTIKGFTNQPELFLDNV